MRGLGKRRWPWAVGRGSFEQTGRKMLLMKMARFCREHHPKMPSSGTTPVSEALAVSRGS